MKKDKKSDRDIKNKKRKKNTLANFNLEKIDWEKVKEIFTPEKESFMAKARRKIEKYPHSDETLSILAGIGAIGLMFLMPGLATVIAPAVRRAEYQRYQRMWRGLARRKLVEIKEDDEGTIVEITEEGVRRALKYKISQMKIKKPASWDGQWRIVIFDVPEQKKRARDVFRQYLLQLDFYMLNRSVFVHPYPCFDEVEFLRQITGVGGEVTFITASSIETADDLKKHFDLD